ncbi:MAG: hypothetical protein V3T09_08475 [bacterium]
MRYFEIMKEQISFVNGSIKEYYQAIARESFEKAQDIQQSRFSCVDHECPGCEWVWSEDCGCESDVYEDCECDEVLEKCKLYKEENDVFSDCEGEKEIKSCIKFETIKSMENMVDCVKADVYLYIDKLTEKRIFSIKEIRRFCMDKIKKIQGNEKYEKHNIGVHDEKILENFVKTAKYNACNDILEDVADDSNFVRL